MKSWKLLAVFACVFVLSSTAEARRIWRPIVRPVLPSLPVIVPAGECVVGTCCEVDGVRIVREGTYYELALARAKACADRMRVGHFLGCPDGCYEGAGMASTEEGAVSIACFWGRRPVRSFATVRRGGSWFSCVLYE